MNKKLLLILLGIFSFTLVFSQEPEEGEQTPQEEQDGNLYKSPFAKNIIKTNVIDLLFAGNATIEYEKYYNDLFTWQAGFIYGFSSDKNGLVVNAFRQSYCIEIGCKYFPFNNDYYKFYAPRGTYLAVFFRYGFFDIKRNNGLYNNPYYSFTSQIYWPGVYVGRQWYFGHYNMELHFGAGYRFTAYDPPDIPFDDPKPQWQMGPGLSLSQFAGFKGGINIGYNF